MKNFLRIFLLIISFAIFIDAHAILQINDNYDPLHVWVFDRATGASTEATFPPGLETLPNTISRESDQSVLIYRAIDGLLICHVAFHNGFFTKKVARGYCCIPFMPANSNVLQAIIVQPFPCDC